MLKPYFTSAVVTKSLLSLLVLGLIGCAGEDDKKNPTNNEGTQVDSTALALNGFWDGGLDQTDTLRVLIYNGDVYGLDGDKGFFGTVSSPADEEVDFTLTSYPFSYEDTGNNEYVADGLVTTYTINGLLASTTSMVGDFSTDTATFGSISLTDDTTYSNNSSLTSLAGKWTTTELELNVTSRGKFLGFNNAEGKDCSFDGEFDIIDASNSLIAMTLNRKNCDDFNGESAGFAAVNAEGELEIYSRSGSSLLFMKFSAPTASGDTPSEGDGETPTDDETETPAA